MICQGHPQDKCKREFKSMIKALFYYKKLIRKYGKYGTMLFKLSAY